MQELIDKMDFLEHQVLLDMNEVLESAIIIVDNVTVKADDYRLEPSFKLVPCQAD